MIEYLGNLENYAYIVFALIIQNSHFQFTQINERHRADCGLWDYLSHTLYLLEDVKVGQQQAVGEAKNSLSFLPSHLFTSRYE